MAAQTIKYPRAPSEELRELLMPGGFLAPVMALNRRKFKGVELGVYFRINDEIQVYCGLTRILIIRRLQRPGGRLNIGADGRYTEQLDAWDTGLFRRWSDGEQGLAEAIEAYLDTVEVNPSLTEGDVSMGALRQGGRSPL